jgi:glycosyltransferase involved in cell wall biosynthesis
MHTSFPNYKFRNKLLLIPVWIFFNRLVCCSQASYSSLPRFFKVLAGNRLRIVPNGVDTKRINRVIGDQPRKPSSRPFTVIAVGRLIKVKNPLSILRAFQQSADPHSRLIFVGEGDLRPALIASNQSNGTAKQVEFSGLISRNQVYERLTGADVFISASFIEGLPVSVLEAMVCGCPVILSDIPPHREIAKGFDCIPLIPPHDTSRLAQEIKRFRSMSAVERANIGHQCRKLAEERFSLNRMHDQYDEIYTGLFAK